MTEQDKNKPTPIKVSIGGKDVESNPRTYEKIINSAPENKKK